MLVVIITFSLYCLVYLLVWSKLFRFQKDFLPDGNFWDPQPPLECEKRTREPPRRTPRPRSVLKKGMCTRYQRAREKARAAVVTQCNVIVVPTRTSGRTKRDEFHRPYSRRVLVSRGTGAFVYASTARARGEAGWIVLDRAVGRSNRRRDVECNSITCGV